MGGKAWVKLMDNESDVKEWAVNGDTRAHNGPVPARNRRRGPEGQCPVCGGRRLNHETRARILKKILHLVLGKITGQKMVSVGAQKF